ncbi:HPr family phosphocarrier protein [Lachnospiraceae bacterium OttesenSCG-928-E19]|nr:HPr family phosphocarrier protein [Lachnospiraceae bacterium OttesenSCG-928-E19]
MVKQTITVTNKSGLHLRPATELSKIAGKLNSDITIIDGEKQINPKSTLILMSAGIKKGTTIEIQCEGETEEEDLQVMLDAIAGGLGEETD